MRNCSPWKFFKTGPTPISANLRIPSGLLVKRKLDRATSSLRTPKNDYLFNGSAVEYFTCFMLMFDFTLPTPGIFVRKFI
jgi:hypothetical protein